MVKARPPAPMGPLIIIRRSLAHACTQYYVAQGANTYSDVERF